MNIYCAFTGDLFHYGHVRFLKNAKRLGSRLIVGVCSDTTVEEYKRQPVLALSERCEVIAGCRYVDAIIPDAPPYVPLNWIKQHKIDVVVAGSDYSHEAIETYYYWPDKLGILKILPYTNGISSSDIIHRCQTIELHEAKLVCNLKVEGKHSNTDSVQRYSPITEAIAAEDFYR